MMTEQGFQTAENITKLPFVERQFVVVIAAATKPEPDAVNKESQPADALRVVRGVLMGAWAYTPGGLLSAAVVGAYKGLKQARDKGLPIQPISLDESQYLDFPPGHPRIGTVYACHPAKPRTYYPLADFHRVAFEGKFAEAMTLLMALGASSVRVEHVTGWSSDFAAFSG